MSSSPSVQPRGVEAHPQTAESPKLSNNEILDSGLSGASSTECFGEDTESQHQYFFPNPSKRCVAVREATPPRTCREGANDIKCLTHDGSHFPKHIHSVLSVAQ